MTLTLQQALDQLDSVTSLEEIYALADADGGRLTKLAASTLGNGLPAAQLRLERLRRGN